RVNVLEWLVSGLADDLARKAPAASELETLRAARELLGRLDAFLSESLGQAYPGTRLLREALERSERQAAPEPETAPGPSAAGPAADGVRCASETGVVPSGGARGGDPGDPRLPRAVPGPERAELLQRRAARRRDDPSLHRAGATRRRKRRARPGRRGSGGRPAGRGGGAGGGACRPRRDREEPGSLSRGPARDRLGAGALPVAASGGAALRPRRADSACARPPGGSRPRGGGA